MYSLLPFVVEGFLYALKQYISERGKGEKKHEENFNNAALLGTN